MRGFDEGYRISRTDANLSVNLTPGSRLKICTPIVLKKSRKSDKFSSEMYYDRRHGKNSTKTANFIDIRMELLIERCPNLPYRNDFC